MARGPGAAGPSSDQQRTPTCDVFLNHRGPDTKKPFVYPLHKKLRKEGFQSFLDRENIGYGEVVFDTIDEAISLAHMHIAIFSERYAESISCLEELHQMVQTKKPIIPVFYDVKPEYLRRPRDPKSPFAEAFKKHEERNPEVMKQWLSALEQVADFRGFSRDKTEYNRTDEELQEEIVIEVAKKIRDRPVKFTDSSAPPIKFTEPHHGRYSWMPPYHALPEEGRGYVSFAVECSNDAMVAISPERNTAGPLYEIVIGGWFNTESVIRRCAFPGHIVCKVPVGLLNYRPETVNYVWVVIDKKTQLILVGRGSYPSEESLFCIYKDTRFIYNARHICFTSLKTPTTYSDIVVASLPRDFTERILNMGKVGIKQSLLEESHYFFVPPRDGIYNWAHHYQLPEQGRGCLSFTAKCSMDVHIALSPDRRTVNPMYEIVLGAFDNTQALIRRKPQGEIVCNVPFELQQAGNYLWVSIDAETQLIQIGRGREPSPESMFCIYKDKKFIREARYACFTSWEAPVTYSSVSVAALPPAPNLNRLALEESERC